MEQQLIDLLMVNKAALAGVLIVAWYLWWYGKTCRCEKCAFHQNEQRIARLKKADDEHNWQHWGDRLGKKDVFDCADIRCPRNRTNRGD